MSAGQPVVLRGSDGVSISGILHEPDQPRTPATGVNLLNPGLKGRVAPNRLNVRLARLLARRGYWVIRIDPPGIGDSGGDLPEEPLLELWQKVQKGAFVDAAEAAYRTLVEDLGVEEVIGLGNCGGAITALLAAERCPRMRRLVLLDVPVTLRSADPNEQDRIEGRGHGARVLRDYARRAKDWRAWLRLLSFRSGYRTIGRALRARFLGRRPARADAGPDETGTGVQPDGAADEERLSGLFLRAVTSFDERGGKMLFINAERDNNTYIFDEQFGDTYLAPGTRLGERHRRVVIAGSNHIYGSPEWREELFQATLQWLETDSVPGRTGGETE
jgi:pimeloyl-ACP methyl ester carboxylesterase